MAAEQEDVGGAVEGSHLGVGHAADQPDVRGEAGRPVEPFADERQQIVLPIHHGQRRPGCIGQHPGKALDRAQRILVRIETADPEHRGIAGHAARRAAPGPARAASSTVLLSITAWIRCRSSMAPCRRQASACSMAVNRNPSAARIARRRSAARARERHATGGCRHTSRVVLNDECRGARQHLSQPPRLNRKAQTVDMDDVGAGVCDGAARSATTGARPLAEPHPVRGRTHTRRRCARPPRRGRTCAPP